MKAKVLMFARSFLCKYYSNIKSESVDPIFVTMTLQEKQYLEGRGWRVYGCFEEEYSELPIQDFPANYLRTSFQSDRFLNRFPHEKRMEILGKEIAFWSRILDNTRPDFLVNETVAIEMAEVMAIEAEKRKIPFYTYLLGFLPNTFYWKPDPFSGRMSDMKDVVPNEDQTALAKEYVSNVVNKSARPFYVMNVKKYNISLKTVIHSWMLWKKAVRKQIRIEENRFKYEDYSIFDKVAFNIHKACCCSKGYYDDISIIEGKHIVFLPMHMEPEAILSYFVDENYDQALLINQVCNCLKNNQYLVVKEHPQQQGMLLTPKYQELRRKNPNLILLPSSVVSFDVIKRCEAIVTLTSTVAWEGLMMGKPAFVLGKIFYDQCKGVRRIDSFKQLKSELQKEKYELPEYDSTVEYAAKMIALFKPGCPTPAYKENTINAFVIAVENLR